MGAPTCPYLPLLAPTCPYLPLLAPTCPYLPLLAPTCPYLPLLAPTCPYLPLFYHFFEDRFSETTTLRSKVFTKFGFCDCAVFVYVYHIEHQFEMCNSVVLPPFAEKFYRSIYRHLSKIINGDHHHELFDGVISIVFTESVFKEHFSQFRSADPSITIFIGCIHHDNLHQLFQ